MASKIGGIDLLVKSIEILHNQGPKNIIIICRKKLVNILDHAMVKWLMHIINHRCKIGK